MTCMLTWPVRCPLPAPVHPHQTIPARSEGQHEIGLNMAETRTERDSLKKMTPLGRTAERWIHLVPHLEEATHCPDQDPAAGVVTLYTPHQATCFPKEATGVQDPTKTLNSPSLTSREIRATGRGTCPQTKTGLVPPSAREWPCLQTEAVIKGYLADPRSPLVWIGPEAKAPDPCHPRETENVLCHHPPNHLERVRWHHWASRPSQAQFQLLALDPARARARAQAPTNPATHCHAVRSC